MKMPPFQKVFEAFSAIADQRVTLQDHEAFVMSSNAKKTYTVKWKDNTYASNDNATYWQSYPGYPVIAVLLLEGRLTVRNDLIAMCAHIDWNAVNKTYHADYDQALKHVLRTMEPQECVEELQNYAKAVYETLSSLDITVKRLQKR